MSRFISEAAAAALEAGRDFKQSNTRVDGHAQRMYLHGNLYITLAGWPTLTTAERLNALNGEEIAADKWYKVED